MLIKRGLVDKEAYKKILEIIIIEHLGRTISQDSVLFDIIPYKIESDENVEIVNDEQKFEITSKESEKKKIRKFNQALK